MQNSFFGVIAGEDIDIPDDFIKKNNIKIYEFNILWDGILQNRSEIYKKMREHKDNRGVGTPQTSQPSIGIFKEMYESTLKEFDEVFVVALSSKLSGCYNSAQQAIGMLDEDKRKKIHLVESSSSSSGSAFLVKELAGLLQNDSSVLDITNKVTSLSPQINVIAMIEDSYWLQKGGRISPAIAMIMNQMKKIGIRPLLAAIDGKLQLLKVRTNAKSKTQGLFDHLHSEIGDKKAELIITHADNPAEAQALHDMIKEKKPAIEVLYINELSPVLGAHVGPDALVVGWRIL